jgi:hypothetical protein
VPRQHASTPNSEWPPTPPLIIILFEIHFAAAGVGEIQTVGGRRIRQHGHRPPLRTAYIRRCVKLPEGVLALQLQQPLWSRAVVSRGGRVGNKVVEGLPLPPLTMFNSAEATDVLDVVMYNTLQNLNPSTTPTEKAWRRTWKCLLAGGTN